jgi:hypothetical protein
MNKDDLKRNFYLKVGNFFVVKKEVKCVYNLDILTETEICKVVGIFSKPIWCDIDSNWKHNKAHNWIRGENFDKTKLVAVDICDIFDLFIDIDRRTRNSLFYHNYEKLFFECFNLKLEDFFHSIIGFQKDLFFRVLSITEKELIKKYKNQGYKIINDLSKTYKK